MVVDLPELLCRVDFPLYQAQLVSPRHLLLAGGGGSAKTGVFNGIVSFKLIICYCTMFYCLPEWSSARWPL